MRVKAFVWCLLILIIMGCGNNGGESSKLGTVVFPDTTGTGTTTTSFTRETEPNNTTVTAMPIVIGGNGVKGQMSGVADVDYYTFNATSGVVSFAIKFDATIPNITPAIKQLNYAA